MDFIGQPMHEMYLCRRFIPITRHEKCNCAVGDLMPFFEYHDEKLWSDLVKNIVNNDMSRLETFLEENKTYRVADRHGNSPIHIAVVFDKREVFDNLVSKDNLRINALNRYGQTPMHLAVMTNSEYYFLELLKRGGDVNLGDSSCCTPLHAAAAKYCPRLCELLLENGANINCQNLLGKSALYHACEYGPIESVYMLLYHGAAANLEDVFRVLPLTAAMQQSSNCFKDIPQSHLDCHEVLFNYTFERNPVSLNLSNLIVVLKINSPLIPEYLKKISNLKYSTHDLKELCRVVTDVDPKNFRLFTRKFGHIVKEMLFTCSQEFHYKMTHSTNADEEAIKLMEFLTMILRFRPTYNFMKGTFTYSCIIETLVDLYKQEKLSKSVFNQMVYFVYSYGLKCELKHIGFIYEVFGFNDVVKFLLDLDAVITHDPPKNIMPLLIYDITFTIDLFVEHVPTPCVEHAAALKFFATPKVRNFFAKSPIFTEALAKLPTVPSLIELSRNVARQHIIDMFHLKYGKDFYRVLRRMPINEVYKKILTYEREIYHV